MCSYKILNGGTTTKCCRIPWQTRVMCFYVILALMKIASCEVLPSVKEFFPSINNDLTKVTWAPEVSIAADINKAKKAHEQIITTKLALPLMMEESPFADRLSCVQYGPFCPRNRSCYLFIQLTFPLWLNGITRNLDNKEIDEFLSLCTHNFPEATISIGLIRWGYKASPKPKEYEAELITKMKDTLTRNNVTQMVAFPVEIRRAALSLDTLPALKDVPGITDSALYMYGRLTDADDYLGVVSQLRKLINNFGKDRVYLALGEKLVKDLI
uniref:Menorin-like domain-containing protein n=1 Tax=Timema bartmani TaxID=61472 RepID=A0A7R9F2Q0_9NEOP|nr:unnamed protein product [Timema bartmani]